MADLSVNIGELQMKEPGDDCIRYIWIWVKSFSDFIDIARIGGIIVKELLFTNVKANPYPRMAGDSFRYVKRCRTAK